MLTPAAESNAKSRACLDDCLGMLGYNWSPIQGVLQRLNCLAVEEQGVVQVTITVPASEGAGSEQGHTLHAMVPSKATAAQLLQVEHLLLLSCESKGSLSAIHAEGHQALCFVTEVLHINALAVP